MQRRLAAILAADVVGYSALIGRDEEATIRALKAHIGVMEPMISLHQGRLVKSTGDGFLAEFGSVIDAVSCAHAMQKLMAERNLDQPETLRLDFRMGVHTGDIVVDGDDILGDGVNIAARLEGVARPGGVAISARVHEDVVGKLDVAFEDMGHLELKNIAQLMQVYAISVDQMKSTAAPVELPDKPSLAVLPFTNMSSAVEDDYFADGITEDIITALASVPWIFVIARNSSFTYKGLAVDVRKVGSELGVRYVLEGSVRRSRDRLRVTGQLIDAETGAHIWAERYDGVVEDVFDLQDQISQAAVAAIAPEIRGAEIERAVHKNPANLDAYDQYLRGLDAFNMGRIDDARASLSSAIEAVPSFSKAIALKAWLGTVGHFSGGLVDTQTRAEAVELANEALRQNSSDPEVAAYAGYTLGFCGVGLERALQLVEYATERSPSFAWAWASSGLLSVYLGLADQALERADMAWRLNPRDPTAFRVYLVRSLAHVIKGEPAQLLDSAQRGLELNAQVMIFVRYKAIALTELDRLEEAAREVERHMDALPGFRVSAYVNSITEGTRLSEALSRPMAEYLRKAGFPE